MVHKNEKKKTKSIKTSVTMTFNTIVCTNEGVDIDDLIKNSTDYLAEPRDDKGCVVVFNLKDYKLSKSDIVKNENNEGLSDKPDKYIHFTFRGIRFTVDTEDKTVQCNGAGLVHEMCGNKNESGVYSINCETSN
jgi:hypothetical protein